MVTEKIGTGKSFAERVTAEKSENIQSEVLSTNPKVEESKVSTSDK